MIAEIIEPFGRRIVESVRRGSLQDFLRGHSDGEGDGVGVGSTIAPCNSIIRVCVLNNTSDGGCVDNREEHSGDNDFKNFYAGRYGVFGCCKNRTT